MQLAVTQPTLTSTRISTTFNRPKTSCKMAYKKGIDSLSQRTRLLEMSLLGKLTLHSLKTDSRSISHSSQLRWSTQTSTVLASQWVSRFRIPRTITKTTNDRIASFWTAGNQKTSWKTTLTWTFEPPTPSTARKWGANPDNIIIIWPSPHTAERPTMIYPRSTSLRPN